MIPINIKSARICAFCRHWFDPSNSAISPKMKDLWLFDPNVKKMCSIKNVETPSKMSCGDYQCKI